MNGYGRKRWNELRISCDHEFQLARSLEPARALQELHEAQALHPNSIEIDEELGRVYLVQGAARVGFSGVWKSAGAEDGRSACD